MPFSTSLADDLLDWFRGNSLQSPPITNLYISLHTSDPGGLGLNGNVTTLIAGARATLPIANLSSPAPASLNLPGREISNTQIISVTNNSGGAAELTHFGIWSHPVNATPSDFLAYGLLSPPVPVVSGDILQFGVGQLFIRGN